MSFEISARNEGDDEMTANERTNEREEESEAGAQTRLTTNTRTHEEPS